MRTPNVVGDALVALLEAAAREGGSLKTTMIAGADYPLMAPWLARDVTGRRSTSVSPCNTKVGDAQLVTLTMTAGLVAMVGKLEHGLLAFRHPDLPEDAWVGRGDEMWFCAVAHEDMFLTSPRAPPAVAARFPLVTPARRH